MFNYKDIILRQIAYEIYKAKSVPHDVRWRKLKKTDIFDFRNLLAPMIVLTMLWSHRHLRKHISIELFQKLCDKLAEKIPESPRWLAPRLGEAEEKFYRREFDKITEKDFRLINLGEESFIGIIAAYPSRKQGKMDFEQIFRPFFNQVGVKNIQHYVQITSQPSNVAEDPQKWSNKNVSEMEITSYADRLGVSSKILLFRHEDLEHLSVKRLATSFVPIFFEREKGIFQPELTLMGTNTVEKLCLVLPEARKHIIDDYFKGHIFEDLLYDILLGRIGIQTIRSKFYTHLYNLVEINGISQKDGVFTYEYLPPSRHPGLRVKKSSQDPFWKGLGSEVIKQQIEVCDLLLVHHKNPKHVILGQCQFTKKYKEEEYAGDLNILDKTKSFIEKHPETRKDLGIPANYDIIPILFTSFSGPLHLKDNSILKVPLASVIIEKLPDFINHYFYSHL